MEGFAAFVIVGGLIVGMTYSRLTKANLDIKGILLNIARALWRFLLGVLIGFVGLVIGYCVLSVPYFVEIEDPDLRIFLQIAGGLIAVITWTGVIFWDEFELVDKAKALPAPEQATPEQRQLPTPALEQQQQQITDYKSTDTPSPVTRKKTPVEEDEELCTITLIKKGEEGDKADKQIGNVIYPAVFQR